MNASISTIQDYKSCPLSYYYKHVVGLRKIEDESAEHHLRFGSAMHKAMETIYKAKMEAERPTDKYEVGTHAGLPTMKKPFVITNGVVKQAKQAFLDAYPRQLDPTDNAKTRETGCFAIESYVRQFGLEDQRKWRVLAVESPESYDNGFITHLDMVAENLEYGGVFGFDWKFTKKKLDYAYWTQFEPNSQIARYTDFINERYGECQGFYIRATSFGYRSRMYRGQPAGYYVNHEQQMFNPKGEMIRMERESSAYWMDRIAHSEATDQWGMNTEHCRFCAYRPICMAGWAWPADEEIITIQYRQTCMELTDSLRPCALDREHIGRHSEQTEIEPDLDILVEV